MQALLVRGLLGQSEITEAALLSEQMLSALSQLGGGYIEVMVRRTAAEALTCSGQHVRAHGELTTAATRLAVRSERIPDPETRRRYLNSQE